MSNIRGMTLIELMVVVVVVAIISSIAYPAYQDQIRKTRRADAKSALMDAAAKMERHYTQFGRYSSTLANSGIIATSPEGYYQIATTLMAAPFQTFNLEATAQGVQAGDNCGVLGIDEAQNKTNSAGLPQNTCW
ncbi:MAG: type IV pilin protein [Pseudomonadota bacterium]